MTEKDEKLLSELDIRIKQLMYLCDSLKEKNIRLVKEIQLKNTEVDNLRTEIGQLEQKYDNLRFARSLSGYNNEEMKQAKERLSKLVQDVEKCIVLLKS